MQQMRRLQRPTRVLQSHRDSPGPIPKNTGTTLLFLVDGAIVTGTSAQLNRCVDNFTSTYGHPALATIRTYVI